MHSTTIFCACISTALSMREAIEKPEYDFVTILRPSRRESSRPMSS